MKNKNSIFSLIKNAFSYHENWQKAWKDPQPKKEYDAVIVGGGGHGLATAYYLAKKHNMRNIAVVEKGWIGGGNTGTGSSSDGSSPGFGLFIAIASTVAVTTFIRRRRK